LRHTVTPYAAFDHAGRIGNTLTAMVNAVPLIQARFGKGGGETGGQAERNV